MIPADAAARAEALDIRRSFIVEAPAGSGKTALLIQRYMKLLLDPEVRDPAEVLAITFTRKATEEIRARVSDALIRVAHGAEARNEFEQELFGTARAVLEKDREHDWKLLEQPGRMNINTIDGLAASIARSLPLLSGGLGLLEPVDDASSLYRLAAQRVLFSLGGEDESLNEALRLVLLHRGVNLGSVEKALADMLSVREQWAPHLPAADEGRAGEDRMRAQMDKVLAYEVCRRLTALDRAIPEHARYTLSRLIDELCEQPGSKGTQNELMQACSGIKGLPGSECVDLGAWKQIVTLMLTKSDGWRKGFAPHFFPIEATKPQQERLKEFFASIESPALIEAAVAVRYAPPYPYPDDQWRLVLPLFRLLRQCLAELQLVFAERRQCDFTEVSLAALQALATPEGAHDLAASLGTRIRHLLMDEMQDTSQRQYDLLRLITAGWDGSSQTVFLVGDPKQSIYIFREARVELFVRALQNCSVGDIALKRLTLTANFRSEERLVQRFNQMFGNIFTKERGDRIEYTPATAMTPTRDGDMHWRLARQPYLGSDASPATRQAAERAGRSLQGKTIAQTIQQWTAKPHPDGRSWKIAVLVRSRSHAPAVTEMLRSSGVTVRSVDIDQLSTRPEILDLLALTRALMHPADRTAWLAVMHAPWCGLSLADLHQISAGDDASHRYHALLPIMQERASLLAEDAYTRASRTLQVLHEAMLQQGRVRFAEWIERTWRSLGGDAYLNGDQTSNALAYFRMLDTITADGNQPSVGELELELSRLYAANAGEASVEVLTIHKSKGLEWDLVFIPSMERKGASDLPPLLDWAEVMGDDGESMGILLAPIQAVGEEGNGLHGAVRAIRKRRSEAELDRVFYVAATRARSSLHMLATLCEKAAPKATKGERQASGGVSANANTLLRCAWETAGPLFESDLVVRLETATQRETSLSSNLVVMPASAGNSGLELAAMEEPPPGVYVPHLPRSFDPRSRFKSDHVSTAQRNRLVSETSRFQRPAGSLGARALGDSAHVFLESLADRMRTGASPQQLLEELPSWSRRIHHVVRSHGLGHRQAEHTAAQVFEVLVRTLQSHVGRWILADHAEAESERAFLVHGDGGRAHFERVDRTFLAGSSPGERGQTVRWIVDFKTGARNTDVEEYLASEKSLYAPKMEAYARAARLAFGSMHSICLALYYPLLDRIVSWPAEEI